MLKNVLRQLQHRTPSYTLFITRMRFSQNLKQKQNKESEGDMKKESQDEYNPLLEVQEFDRSKLKQLITSTEENIFNYSLNVNALPDNNHFGEVALFISPPNTLNKDQGLEYSGVLFTTGLTALNYFGLIFPYSYVFPYLCLLSLNCIINLLRRRNLYKDNIYQISLINEHEVRVTFITGESIVVDIKNIYISSQYLDRINAFETVGNQSNSNINQMYGFLIPIVINSSRQCRFELRSNAFGTNGQAANQLSLTNLPLLFGILNRKTRKLAIVDK